MILSPIVWRSMWMPDLTAATGPKYVALAHAIASAALRRIASGIAAAAAPCLGGAPSNEPVDGVKGLRSRRGDGRRRRRGRPGHLRAGAVRPGALPLAEDGGCGSAGHELEFS